MSGISKSTMLPIMLTRRVATVVTTLLGDLGLFIIYASLDFVLSVRSLDKTSVLRTIGWR